MRIILFGFAVVLSTVICADSAFAQERKPSYQPAKPTLSPYLYLTRPQAGFFPNYHTFVEPLRTQTQINQIQQTQISGLDKQLQQQKKSTLTRPTSVAPTGHSSVYGSHSHYYSSSPNSVGGNRQGRGGR